MAYLTQYSGSVPVIKFNIDQSFMTIGQNFDMDICVPEDGISDNHAAIEVVNNSESYRFIIKSHKDYLPISINGETALIAELKDGDWINIGDVEFQFTNDGITDIKQVEMPIKEEVDTPKLQVVKDESFNSKPLEIVEDIQVEAEPMAADTMDEDHRFSRRLQLF